MVFLPVLLRAVLGVHSEPTAYKCAAAYVSFNMPYLGLSQLAYHLKLYCFQMFTVALLDPSGILHILPNGAKPK